MSIVIAEPKFDCTHKQAVKRIALWLRNSQHCTVVLAERVSLTREQPDGLGFKGAGTGHSILVECKVSRADFHADKEKSFRRYEDEGVGDYRYYAAPRGILKPEDMPDGWGLLEIHEHTIRIKKPADLKQANKRVEVGMLVSAIRRLELSATVFVRHEDTPDEEAA